MCVNMRQYRSNVMQFLVICIAMASCRTLSRQDILNQLLNVNGTVAGGSKYDSSIAPDFEKDTPTIVKVQIYLQNIYSVSESSMDFSVDVLLRQRWTDGRLHYGNMSKSPWLELDNKLMDKVWVPDTYFANEKKAHVHEVTVPNRMMHLYRNGTVLYSMRLSLTLGCAMRLQKYPLDDQKCPVIVESYAYTIDNVLFEWTDTDPFKIMSDVAMPQFVPKTMVVWDKCNQHFAGSFACLTAYVHLKRKVGYYIVQVFIPSILIVVLSWVSFWVDHDAVPARISLGVLTVLTMTTQSSGSRQSLPQVSYVKAIDVWMSTCLLFVFIALLEYSCINVIARKKIKMKKEDTLELKPETGALLCTAIRSNEIDAARKIDKISRVAFPVAFIIFNIAFWTSYVMMPNPE